MDDVSLSLKLADIATAAATAANPLGISPTLSKKGKNVSFIFFPPVNFLFSVFFCISQSENKIH